MQAPAAWQRSCCRSLLLPESRPQPCRSAGRRCGTNSARARQHSTPDSQLLLGRQLRQMKKRQTCHSQTAHLALHLSKQTNGLLCPKALIRQQQQQGTLTVMLALQHQRHSKLQRTRQAASGHDPWPRWPSRAEATRLCQPAWPAQRLSLTHLQHKLLTQGTGNSPRCCPVRLQLCSQVDRTATGSCLQQVVCMKLRPAKALQPRGASCCRADLRWAEPWLPSGVCLLHPCPRCAAACSWHAVELCSIVPL